LLILAVKGKPRDSQEGPPSAETDYRCTSTQKERWEQEDSPLLKEPDVGPAAGLDLARALNCPKTMRKQPMLSRRAAAIGRKRTSKRGKETFPELLPMLMNKFATWVRKDGCRWGMLADNL